MKSIKTHAKFLEVFCLVVVFPGLIIGSVLKWVDQFYGFGAFHKFWSGISYSYQSSSEAMPILSRILTTLIDGISLGLLLWGLFCFLKILRCYRRGQVFTLATFSLFRKISRIAFAWAIYALVKSTLLTLVATIHNPPGQRIIEITIGSNEIINILIVSFFLIVTSIMHEGYLLKNEQDLTV